MQASSEREGLPAPTGRYPVGRVSLDWVDSERAEIYSGNPADRRELVVWAWYPAAPQPDAKRADYLPEPWAPAGQFLGLDAVGLLSHAVADAAVANDQSSYPVLVFSPSGFPPLLLAAIAEDLVSCRASRVRPVRCRRGRGRIGDRCRRSRRREGDHLRWLADGSPAGPPQLHRAGQGGDPPELHGRAVAAIAGRFTRQGDAGRDPDPSTAHVADHLRSAPRLLRQPPPTGRHPIGARGAVG